MIFKKDSLTLGLILGFIAPFIGFMIYKYVKFSVFSLKEMWQWMMLNKNYFTVSLSISLLANAVLFTLYINAHKDKTAKGIFAVTCLYGLLILTLKTFF